MNLLTFQFVVEHVLDWGAEKAWKAKNCWGKTGTECS